MENTLNLLKNNLLIIKEYFKQILETDLKSRLHQKFSLEKYILIEIQKSNCKKYYEGNIDINWPKAEPIGKLSIFK